MNQSKSVETGRGNRGAGARLLALAAAIFVLGALAGTAHALNPIMHNSSSVGSGYWGGGWGNTPNSKYGQFTCTTCHAAGPSSGNVKQVRNNIVAPANGTFPGSAVVFHSSTSYGSDYISRTSSNRICEVCHTVTKHHRYDNSAATVHKGDRDCVACHLHSNGFKRQTVEGGGPCSDCHSDFYGSPGTYGMHSNVERMSYKHYLDNDAQTTATGPAGIPDGTDTNVSSRRCTMCHVEHTVFNTQATATAGRAFNLRDRADGTNITTGYNDDYNLCLSCHYQPKTKYLVTPNGSSRVIAVPFQGLSYSNATSVLTFSTHGYAVTSRFDDEKLGNSTFRGICVKCHNDTFGGNGELGYKSAEKGQDSAIKFGEHNSTIPSRFAVFGNMFYQRPATGTTLTYNDAAKTITIAPSPGWVSDMHLGHTVTVTAGTGNNHRMRVISNTADTITLASAFPTTLDNNSMIDIADDNISVDDTCFACHSRAGQDKPAANVRTDWYNAQPMKDSLEGIKDLFVGDSGSLTSKLSSAANITVTTQKSWGAGTLVGYQLKTPGGTRTISGQSSSSTGSGPYSTSFTVSPRLTSAAGPWQILKPSSHPLDSYSRHDSSERVAPAVGWNKGDSGSTTSSSSTGSIADTTKAWKGSDFGGMYIWFPGGFDAGGNPAKSQILASGGGGVGVVNFTPIPGFTPDSAGGDNYFIGTITGTGRHAACADCHNTHATFTNPEGYVTTSSGYTMSAADSTNRSGWRDNLWVGFLLRVRSTTGVEQIRYVTAFDTASGRYTVSLPWSTLPDSGYTYEVLMGDKWTAADGQSGGRAGSGSSGSWGMIVTGWRTAVPTAGFNNMTTPLGYRMIENIFDNVSSNGLRGSPNAGQRDLCVKCHSSFSFGMAPPSTPSGNASGAPAKSTDVAKEFNPSNLAHHAVYARGKNQPIAVGAAGFKAGTTTAAGTATTVVDSSLGTPAGTVVGKTVVILTGAAQGQARLISAVSLNTLTVSPALTAAPGNTVKYAVLNSFNPNWPIYSAVGLGTVSIGGGSAALSGSYKLPKTVLPGWYIYTWADNTWREVRTVDGESTFSVTGGNVSGSPFILTAGLGNAFVPPYGPWSILRCTDCHGTTKTDPVGPHASVNKWLIKDADTMSFYYFAGGAETNVIGPIAPGLPTSVAKPKAYFCYNCHRRDVYGDKDMKSPGYYLQSRQPHANYMDTNANTVDDAKTKWGVHCRMCHGGDVVGGIHGTNRRHTSTPSGGSNDVGKRFLNGSAWGTHTLGVKRSTTQVVGGCYTLGSPADASVDNCAHNHSGTAYVNKATYDYDTP
ncbi:MAG TPA: hypothetical protein DCZ75_18085 [Geobacter sp.]|nr:hypothetical protein [Geobacter sp.]